MTGRLPKTVELRPNEPCFSLLCRLAEVNDIPPSQLARAAETSWSDVKIGSHQAVRTVAQLAGSDPRILRRATPRLVAKRLYLWGSERLPDRLIRSKDLRVCPKCIKEDQGAGEGPPYVRSEWLLRGFRVCPSHSVQLVDIGSLEGLKWRQISDLSGQEPEPENATKTAGVEFERYLRNRIHRSLTRTDSLLGRMTLSEVVETAEMFGALFRNGAFKKTDLTYSAWHDATEIGFEALSRGRTAFVERIEQHLRSDDGIMPSGYTRFLGPVHPWLNKNRDDPRYTEIISLMRTFADRNLQSEYEHPFLGRRLQPVDGCTVTRLSQLYQVKPKMVRVFLARSGVRPSGNVSSVTGEADLYPDRLAKIAMKTWLDLISGKAAAALLSVPKSTFLSLIQHGVVKEHRFEKLRGPRYSEKKLAVLCKKLDALAGAQYPSASGQPTTRPSPKLDLLANAARRVPCHAGEIVQLLLKQKLTDFLVVPREQGMPTIYVNPDEVRSVLPAPKITGLSEDEAAARLGVSTQAVRSLRKVGYLERLPCRHSETRKSVKRFTPTSVHRFHKRYVSEATLARDLRMTRSGVVTYLAGLGCEPEIVVPKAPKFFRRSVVTAAGRRLRPTVAE